MHSVVEKERWDSQNPQTFHGCELETGGRREGPRVEVAESLACKNGGARRASAVEVHADAHVAPHGVGPSASPFDFVITSRSRDEHVIVVRTLRCSGQDARMLCNHSQSGNLTMLISGEAGATGTVSPHDDNYCFTTRDSCLEPS